MQLSERQMHNASELKVWLLTEAQGFSSFPRPWSALISGNKLIFPTMIHGAQLSPGSETRLREKLLIKQSTFFCRQY